jgi:hypothetical protein
MSRLPLVRFLSGVVIALLGLIVAGCSYMNVGYFADLGETAARLGDDGTLGSLMSFAAGVLLVGLGVLSAAMSPSPTFASRRAEELGTSKVA